MIVAFLTQGEGWHNYHHAFPWDYKAAEFGWKVNVSTMLIDFFDWIGLAYDLKMVSKEVLNSRVKRTGDGTHWTAELHDFDCNRRIHASRNEVLENFNEKKNYVDVGKLKGSMDYPSWGWDEKADKMEVRCQLTSIVNSEKI